MEVTVNFSEEDYFLAEYYAEVTGVTIEEALKGALMDKVRELYEKRAGARSESQEDTDRIDQELNQMYELEDR